MKRGSLLGQVGLRPGRPTLGFARPSPRIRLALRVGDDRHSQPSRVLVERTWRHRRAKDSRVACPAAAGRESIARCAQDRLGWRPQWMDL